MTTALRKYIASTVSELDPIEVYELNRWLNRPFVKSKNIEEFHPYVERHLNLDFIFELPEQEKIFSLNPGMDNELIIHSPMKRPKVVPRFFALALPEYENIDFRYTKTIIFDLGREHIFLTSDSTTIKKDNSIPPVHIKFNSEYHKIKTENIALWNPEFRITEFNTDFCKTETKELASFFLPQINKIELLNPAEFLSGDGSTPIIEGKFYKDIKEPDITLLQNLKITKNDMMFDYTNIELKRTSVFALNFTDEIQNQNSNGKSDKDNLLSGDLIKLLEPVYDLSDELKNEILINLPSYQKTGAKFLFNSNFAFLHDQFELGKEIQAVMALKMLLRTRKVKNILIVTSREREYVTNYIGNEIMNGIWQTNLSLLLPDFAFKFYTSYKNFTIEKNNQSIITGLTYDILEKSFYKKEVNKEYFAKYDAVIFDDIAPATFKQKSVRLLLKNSDTNYLWFLSDFSNQALVNTVQNIKSEEPLKCLGRNIHSVHKSRRNNYDFYLPLDEANIKVNKDHFDVGREQLDDVMGLGNILRFRPNVFQILQNEQRILNFVGDTGRSNKSDLLLYHISRIFDHEERVLVYTQYDESGLKQLSNLLKDNKINYTEFASSDSEKILNEKLESCKRFEGSKVYLTNIKPNAIRFNFPNVSHIINFDNWWNPVSRWQLENKLEMSSECLTIYNYYYNDTIESKAEKLMNSKGLKEKLFLNLIPPDNIYSYFDESDWCGIFGISDKHFPEKTKKSLILNNMKSLVESAKTFLAGFSFRDIETTANVKDHSFNITAVSNAGKNESPLLVKCFFAEHLSSEFVNNLVANVKKETRYAGIVIITSGTISRTNVVLPENTILIESDKLKNYLHVINAG